jgi:putative flippase GtrA
MSPSPRALPARLGRVDLNALVRAPLFQAPLWRFLAVGVLGLTVDALLFSILHGAGLSRAAGRALSLAAATAVTWRLNRRFTFAATGRRQRAELGRYAAVVLGAQGISYATFLAISWAAPHIHALVALVCGAVVATAFSFTGQRFFTFRPTPGPIKGPSHAA